MQYKLKRNVLVTQENDDLFILTGITTMYNISENKDTYISLLKFLLVPRSFTEIFLFFENQSMDIDNNTLLVLINDLVDKNIIELFEEYRSDILSVEEIKRYDRQLGFLGALNVSIDNRIKFQETLKNSHVWILGVGGVGGHLAYALTAMGVGQITLIDSDIIELSNVTRQVLYDERDIGKFKVDVAKSKLLNYNNKIKLNTSKKFVTSTKDLEEIIEDVGNPTFVFLSADQPRGEIAYITDDVFYQKNIPVLSSAPTAGLISIGPLIQNGITKSLKELFLNTHSLSISQDIIDINSGYVSDIIEPYNALAANFAINEFTKFILDKEKTSTINRIFYFNPLNYSLDSKELT